MTGYNMRHINDIQIENCYDNIFCACWMENMQAVNKAKNIIVESFGNVKLDLCESITNGSFCQETLIQENF
jgi:hypothetical protein